MLALQDVNCSADDLRRSDAGEPLYFAGDLGYEFCLESYGVRVVVRSNSPELLDQAKKTAHKALVGRLKIFDTPIDRPRHSFQLAVDDNQTFYYSQNDDELYSVMSRYHLLKFFDGMLRLTVGEFAVSRVFLHAGVVGWKGKAIILPANSFQGKTTLTAELVRQGAEYYSDEYAVLDPDGLVHPFERKLSVRSDGEELREDEISAESLGGTVGRDPIKVGAVVLTKFTGEAKWEPEILTAGRGIIETVPHAAQLRADPKFCLSVLEKVSKDAVFIKADRGEAAEFAKLLLQFIDISTY